MKITKEDLKNLASDRMKVQDLQQQIDDIAEAAAISVQQYGERFGSPSAYYYDRMADTIDKLNECKMEYAEAQLEYAERYESILNAIRGLPTPFYEVLYGKYVSRKTWNRIAIELHYCESNVRKLHDKAIKLLQQRAAGKEEKRQPAARVREGDNEID